MGFRTWATRLFRLSGPLERCPACGDDADTHELRTLARERFAAGRSGIEHRIAEGDFRGAAALDDRSAMGDLLIHQLLRCGPRVSVITVEDPLMMEARVRAHRVLEGAAATAAWSAAPAPLF